MKKIAIILSLLISVPAVSQTTQQGIIQEYNEKAQKTPLPGVEINVRSAQSTVSDQSGHFHLQFLTLSPGEKVNIRRIEKLGYEVFNKEAIEQWNINPKDPFIIVMCRSDKFKRIRDNYERVSSESYARQLKKEEESLLKMKEEGKLKDAEYQKKLMELYENYEKRLDNLENYVDKFSRIDLSELSITEQEIIELVQQGRMDEAIQKYEEQDYVGKYADEVAQIKEVSSAIDQLSNMKKSKELIRDSLLNAIDRQIDILRLTGGKDNFDKIGIILHDVYYANPSEANLLLNYLEFMFQQGRYNEIQKELDTLLCMGLSPQYHIRGLELKLQSIINSGNYSIADSYIKQLTNLLDSVQINHTNIEYSKYYISKAYFRIGGLFMEINHPEKALPYFVSAEKALPETIPTNCADSISVFLRSNIGLAICYLYLGDNTKSRDLASKMYERIKTLINTKEYSTDNFSIIKDITDAGTLCEACKQFDHARELYSFVNVALNDLKETNPDRALPCLANLLSGQGVLEERTGNFPESESFYLQAIDYYKELAQRLPHYVTKTRKVMTNLSSLYLKTGLNDKALSIAKEAYSIISDYYQAEPYFYAEDYRHTMIALARAYDKLKKYEDAEFYYLEAQKLNELKYKEIGEEYLEKYWQNSVDLAVFYVITEQHSKAVPILRNELEYGKRFITQNHNFFNAYVNMIYFLGRSNRIIGNYKEAVSDLNECLRLQPNKFVVHLEIARAFANLHKWKKVKSHIKVVRQNSPNLLNDISKDDILYSYIKTKG